MAKNLTLELFLKAKDGLSGVVNSAVTKSDKDFKELREQIKKTADTFDNFGKKCVIAGGALMAGSAIGVKTAGDFEQGFNNVSTLIDTNVESLADMKKELLDIAKSSPKAINDLTEGLYNIRSAGVSAAGQFKVLKASEMLAVAGLSTTAESVDIITSTLNAFNLEEAKANDITNIFFKAVEKGKTNMAEFAQGFGSSAGVVASANVQIDEYAAAVAAMTTTGLKANNAHTQLSAALSSLTRSSKEQVAIFNQLGAKSFKDLVVKSGGMVNAFKKIDKAVGSNEAKMVALMGSINGYKAVLGLTNTVNAKFAETLSYMRDGSDAATKAYNKQMSGMNIQISETKNRLQALSITFGEGLLPLMKTVNLSVQGVINLLDKMPAPLKSFISISTLTAGAGLLALGTLAIGAGTVTRSFADILKAYRAIDIYLWAHPITMPPLKLGTFTGNLNNLAASISKSCISMRSKLNSLSASSLVFSKTAWTKTTAALNAPINFQTITSGLKGLGRAYLAPTKGALAFSGALLTNPITWVAAAIVAGGLLIYKYWEPLSNFFKGVWSGIAEATKPLHPLFEKIAAALLPINNWFKELIKPVKDVDNAAFKFGETVGKAIGNAINWVAKMIGKVGELFIKVQPLYWLFKGGKWALEVIKKDKKDKKNSRQGRGDTPGEFDGSHEGGLDYVPFDGYRAILHRGESVLTRKQADILRSNNLGIASGNLHISYNPSVVINGTTNETKEKFMQILKEHKDELVNIIKDVLRQEERRRYA